MVGDEPPDRVCERADVKEVVDALREQVVTYGLAQRVGELRAKLALPLMVLRGTGALLAHHLATEPHEEPVARVGWNPGAERSAEWLLELAHEQRQCRGRRRVPRDIRDVLLHTLPRAMQLVH